MSGSESKAVFLSYASQDAAAAKRICEALRAAGVEVWFDQSELRGGDAWDTKIRKQIKDCALFIPIVSANTQARREGYFRLEWKLADDRTHLMAKGTPFLVPVCIDDTKDWDAVVPDAFMAVQWTRLAGGEGAAAFGERVKALLSGEVAPASSRQPGEAGKMPALRQQPFPRRWLVPVIVSVVALGALVIWRPWAARVAAPAPLTEAQQMVEKARQVLERGDELNRENYLLAEDLVKRAVALDPAEASAWELHARLSYFMVWHSVDNSEARRDAMRRQAERARALAPASPEVQLTVADVRTALREDLPAIAREMEEMARRDPTNWRVQRALGNAYRFMRRPDAALDALRRARELADGSVTTSADLVNLLMRTDRHPEAEAVMREALGRQSAARLLTSDMVLRTSWRGDLAGAATALEQWPDWLRAEDRGAVLAWRTWFWSGQYDKALAAIQRVPRDYLRDVFFVGPRAVLTARAHESAGHLDAARVDWQTVVQLTDRELAASPDAVPALYWKAWARARLGDLPGAQAIAGQMEQRNQFRFDRDALGVLNSGTKALYFGAPGAVALWTTVGRTDRALAALPDAFAAVDQFALTRAMLELDPAFAPLRNEPAFREGLAKASAPSDLRSGRVEIDPKSVPADKSVAVLAFANLSNDKGNEYFSDGISEELLNVLAKVPGLKVTARTSSFHFKGKDTAIPEIARQLGVAYVVEGSVARSDNLVRVNARLIKADDGFQVWSDTINKELKDIFALQDEIAGVIAQNLKLKLGAKSPARAVHPEAYRLFLQARAIFNRGVPGEYAQSIQLLRDSAALDGDSALTWAWLGTSYVAAASQGAIPAASGFALGRDAANRAVALDPELAQGYAALASVQMICDWNWAGADASMQRALVLAPGDATIVGYASNLAQTLGQTERALQTGRKARELDPLGFLTGYMLGKAHLQAGQFAEMERVAEQMIVASPTGRYGHVFLIYARLLQGRTDAAAQALDRMDPDFFQLTCAALVRHTQGRKADSDAALHELKVKFAKDGAYQIAEVHAWRHEVDQAFEWLETGYQERDAGMTWLTNDPLLRNLRDDARWPALLKKMKLPNLARK